MVVMPAQFDAFMKNKGDFSSFEGVIHSIGAIKDLRVGQRDAAC